MILQLASLFCFGLVITFVVFLGVVRARQFNEAEQRGKETATDGNRSAASPIRHPAVVDGRT